VGEEGSSVATVDELICGLAGALEHADEWLRRVDAFRSRHERTSSLFPDLAKDLETLRQLRERASSSLLNVAFLGPFASGKSVLVSGLQKQLTLKRVTTGDGPADRYYSLLRSSPRPSVACVASVVPVRDPSSAPAPLAPPSVRMRHADSAWTEWGPVGPAGVSADDQAEEITEIEIALRDYAVPATLYDIPAASGLSRPRDAVIRERLADADCFVYVARSTRALSDGDLDTMLLLFQQHKVSGKPVIWVLTAIDQALDLDMDGMPTWKATAAWNNEFLNLYFSSADRPEPGFIGKGFVAVSPVLEARGRYLESRQPEGSSAAVADNRMDHLRGLLAAILESGVGRHRARSVMEQAKWIVARYRTALLEAAAAEQAPVGDVRPETEHLRERLRSFDNESAALGIKLESELGRRVSTACRSFDQTSLSDALHAAVDDLIRASDLRQEAAKIEVEVRKTQVLYAWLSSADGPITSWRRQLAAFQATVLLAARDLLGEIGAASDGPLGAPQDLGQFRPLRSRPLAAASEDLVSTASGLAGTIAALVGGAVAAVTIPAPAAKFLPLGVAVAGSGLYLLVRRRRQRRSSLEMIREEELAILDSTAREAREWFRQSASASGQRLIDQAWAMIDEQQYALGRRVLRVHAEATALADQHDLVAELDVVCTAGARVLAELSADPD
jgi:hypothetical protein